MKREKLNTGGLGAMAIALIAMESMNLPETNFRFQLLCLLTMSLMGGLGWISFKKFGLFLKR